ncbi:MAG: zf-HC2 domain-containing protein [Actinobacteria bacterium]|nr:zf-HC2 domain-containing protein [Actinomycetota bacterium]
MSADDPCEKCEQMLQPFLDRELSPEEVVEAEVHLDACEYCRRRYRFEESLRSYVRLTASERMPPGLLDKIKELRGQPEGV